MKLYKTYIIALTFTALFSCSENDTALNTADNKVSRESGQIPKDIHFMDVINKADGDYITVLKEFKSEYGTTDFYNNLFEVTASFLFTSDNFAQLDADSYRFILDEMRSVEYNMANIQHIPLLLDKAKDTDVINDNDYKSIAFELYIKNEKQLKSMKWTNNELKTAKKAEFEDFKTALFYPRTKYITN